jgi:hypothetical protein
MKRNGQKILICDCERTMALDGKAVCRALAGDEEARVHNQLCRAEIEAFRDAIANERRVVVACTQEAPLFAETAAELAAEVDLKFTNIRETAGWSAAGGEANAKIAALLAAAAEPFRPPLPFPCARTAPASCTAAMRLHSKQRSKSAASSTSPCSLPMPCNSRRRASWMCRS